MLEELFACKRNILETHFHQDKRNLIYKKTERPQRNYYHSSEWSNFPSGINENRNELISFLSTIPVKFSFEAE